MKKSELKALIKECIGEMYGKSWDDVYQEKEDRVMMGSKNREIQDKFDELVDQYKDNPKMWMRVANDFEDMASGGDGGGIRNEYYIHWSDEDFKKLIDTIEG